MTSAKLTARFVETTRPPKTGRKEYWDIADTDPMVIDATTGTDPHPQFHAHCYEPWLIARRNVARQALSTC